ncbi:MAG: 30S ribosomal protein S2 [Acidobacteriota bacterium]
MLIIDVNKEALAVKEANVLGIPVIAVLDTNTSPDGIAFPVPGNADASREIERAAYDFQIAVEAEEEIVVGVNRFQIKEETSIPTLKIDPAFEQAQVERVRKVRAERNSAAATVALEKVEAAARSGENLMPPIIAAVEAYATLGEIADKMRAVFGEYTEAAY